MNSRAPRFGNTGNKPLAPKHQPQKKPRFPKVTSSRELSILSREVEDGFAPRLEKACRDYRLISERLKEMGVRTPTYAELRGKHIPTTFRALEDESEILRDRDCLCGSTTPPEDKAKFREKAAFLLGATSVLSAKVLRGPDGIYGVCGKMRTLPPYAGETGVFLANLERGMFAATSISAINLAISGIIMGDALPAALSLFAFNLALFSPFAAGLAFLRHERGKSAVRSYSKRLEQAQTNADRFLGHVERTHGNLAIAIQKLQAPNEFSRPHLEIPDF